MWGDLGNWEMEQKDSDIRLISVISGQRLRFNHGWHGGTRIGRPSHQFNQCYGWSIDLSQSSDLSVSSVVKNLCINHLINLCHQWLKNLCIIHPINPCHPWFRTSH
jgi:hypothetical protein